MPWVFLRIERWIGKIIQVLTWDLLQKMVNQDLGNGVHFLELYVYIYMFITFYYLFQAFRSADLSFSFAGFSGVFSR